MDAAVVAWKDFFVAMAGATAALSGLLIVAMSVNIRRVLASPSLPPRAAAAISAVAAALVVSCLVLVTGQPRWVFGIEVLVVAAVLWLIWSRVPAEVRADPQPNRPAAARYGVPAIAPALFTIGGALLIAGAPAGFALLAAASLVAIVAGLLFAWVALVEILR